MKHIIEPFTMRPILTYFTAIELTALQIPLIHKPFFEGFEIVPNPQTEIHHGSE
jgi:hypothetical protein